MVTACAAANANQLRLARDCPQERLLEGAQLLRVRAGREQGGGVMHLPEQPRHNHPNHIAAAATTGDCASLC